MKQFTIDRRRMPSFHGRIRLFYAFHRCGFRSRVRANKFRIVTYDNGDGFMMTNKIATSNSVTAVLIGLFLCFTANAQTDNATRTVPACFSAVVKGSLESDVTACLGPPQFVGVGPLMSTPSFSSDTKQSDTKHYKEWHYSLDSFIRIEFNHGKATKVKYSITPAPQQQPTVNSLPPPVRNPNESDEHWFARQQYELAFQAYGNAVQREAAMVNEVARLQSKWYSGMTIDQQQEILNEARDLRSQLDIASHQIDLLKLRVEHADDCVATYHQTIDKKTSDLTTRETQQIAACQSINLYPPAK